MRDRLDRMIFAEEFTGVVPHNGLPLGLRHRNPTHVKGLSKMTSCLGNSFSSACSLSQSPPMVKDPAGSRINAMLNAVGHDIRHTGLLRQLWPGLGY